MFKPQYTPGRWHNAIGSPAGHLARQYSTPRAWYRRSIQSGPVNSESSIYSDERYVCAAAIFPRGFAALQAMVDSCPWAVIVFYPGRDYIIVLVSCEDRQAWVTTARWAGAIAWYVIDSAEGQLYHYTQQTQLTSAQDYRPQRDGEKRGKKGLNHEEIRDQIIQGYYNDAELAEQYSVTRQTISNIRKKFKLGAAPINPRRGRPRALVRQTSD